MLSKCRICAITLLVVVISLLFIASEQLSLLFYEFSKDSFITIRINKIEKPTRPTRIIKSEEKENMDDHFLFAKETFNTEFRNLNESAVLVGEIDKIYARTVASWTVITEDESGMRYKYVYYIYATIPIGTGKLLLQEGAIEPVSILEYRCNDEKNIQSIEINENGNKWKFFDAVVNKGFAETGDLSDWWYFYASDNHPNIEALKTQLIMGFSFQSSKNVI